MGQSLRQSCKIQSSGDRETELYMDLSELPGEVLHLILRHLPASVLLRNCQYVCKRWHCIIDSQAFWKFKAEEENKHLQIVKKCVPANMDWKKLCLKEPFHKNLIQNPFGKEGFKGWDILNGGDGWSIRTFPPEDLAGVCSTFVSSYFWCKKSQTINLLEEGLWEDLLDNYQPEICIQDWYSSHRDCGGEYLMKVKLLAADKRTVLQKYNSGLKTIPIQPLQCWEKVAHVFRNYGPGVRYVKFKHAAKDILFWKGHFGTWVTKTSITVRLKDPAQK
ncbi:F-box only protein 27-like [Polyodon spathula]|nr:F-box only protein 27-like [Polyodon spathula]